MSELTPVAIENHIRELSNRIAKSASVCNARYSEYLDADREYDRAFATAYLQHDAAQAERKYAAEIATTHEREKRDVADAAYKYADRLSKALSAELMAYQSLNKSVLTQYSAAGVGER